MRDAEGVEVWLVRHGQTVANVEGRFSGWSDVDLTEAGRVEARLLRPRLAGVPFVAVHSSDLRRAVETARIVYGEPLPDPRLREMGFGELEGQRWSDLPPSVRAQLDDFDRFEAPGGERMSSFRSRVHGFLDTLAPGRHLVVTHGGVVRLLTRGLLDRFLPNTSVVAMTWPGRRIRLEYEPSASQGNGVSRSEP